MPDKTLRVVTYAAGASLAAVTLIYVFGPTYFLDSGPSSSPSGPFSSRKKGVVGLSNPANDCFINSVLQALAGLGDLRLYLIREIHRRGLDAPVYARPVPPGALAGDESGAVSLRVSKDTPDWKLEGLQKGSVTQSLKDILDALNERPIYKKTISAAPFLAALEEAFRQRISRQQQDAQEFLQVVAERLCDEYHAGRRARQFATQTAALSTGAVRNEKGEKQEEDEEEGFPLEGRVESQIECLTCGFKPRPTKSTFCTLTLNVPRVSSTTLGACFDGMFKTEHIDDFRCENCRLLHAVAFFESEMQRCSSETARAEAQAAAEKLRLAINTDPEKALEDVVLPELRHAPKRKIARHIRLTRFPKVLAIHLSRSIFDAGHLSLKNSAKVAFPEHLPLGGLLQQRKYKLLGVVTHKGNHHSGHYESFRRQNTHTPFSNPSTFQASGAYSRTASPASTPRLEAQRQDSDGASAPTPPQDTLTHESEASPSPLSSDFVVVPGASRTDASCIGTGSEAITTERPSVAPSSGAKDRLTVSPGLVASSSGLSSLKVPSEPRPQVRNPGLANGRIQPTHRAPAPRSKERKQQTRWWRISDDKVKEASTRDVLGMQREVYLLFYELETQSL